MFRKIQAQAWIWVLKNFTSNPISSSNFRALSKFQKKKKVELLINSIFGNLKKKDLNSSLAPFLKKKKLSSNSSYNNKNRTKFLFSFSSRGKFDYSKKGTKLKFSFIYLFLLDQNISQHWKKLQLSKEKAKLGLGSQFETRPKFYFSCFCPIQISFGTKRSSDGANIIC